MKYHAKHIRIKKWDYKCWLFYFKRWYFDYNGIGIELDNKIDKRIEEDDTNMDANMVVSESVNMTGLNTHVRKNQQKSSERREKFKLN